MTFVRKEKLNLANILLLAVIFPLIISIIYLIALYNQTVNLKHGIADMRAETQKLEASAAGYKDKVFALFDPGKVETLARERGLVKETKPAYLEVNQWALASHL